jgi:hypothetical protein
MKGTHSITLAAVMGMALLLAAWTVPKAVGQSPDPQTAPQATAEQQSQFDQLKALGSQMQKDRDAVHAAISEFGWDSDQTDAARGKLFQTRSQYRSLRRSLRSQGVAVPPPAGSSADGRGFRSGPRGGNWDAPRRAGRGGCRGGHPHWRGHCRGCGW